MFYLTNLSKYITLMKQECLFTTLLLQKHSSAVGSGDETQMTVLSSCSAAGYTLPPFVIIDRKSLKPELTVGEVPGTVYSLLSKGWVYEEQFELWFTHHFLAYTPPVRPLLFLMDGHLSHFHTQLTSCSPWIRAGALGHWRLIAERNDSHRTLANHVIAR